MTLEGSTLRTSLIAIVGLAVSSGCAPEATVAVGGPINDLGNSEPLAGVEVCWVDADQCTQTGVDGRYRFEGVPAGSEMTLTIDAPGYAAGLVPVGVGAIELEVAPLALGSTLLMELQAGLLGVPSIPGTGQLVFGVSNGIPGDGINVPDISASLTPAAGEGPFYTTPAGLPNTELESTSAHGGGVLVNIPSGRYTLDHVGLPAGCTMVLGWGQPSAVDFEVQADRATYIRIECMAGS